MADLKYVRNEKDLATATTPDQPFLSDVVQQARSLGVNIITEVRGRQRENPAGVSERVGVPELYPSPTPPYTGLSETVTPTASWLKRAKAEESGKLLHLAYAKDDPNRSATTESEGQPSHAGGLD